MTLALALLLGVLIGISLGALGGGGSILTVPALVYVLGDSARSATTASLVIVGVTALVGALGHARAHHVRWTSGIVFGSVGIATSFVGTALNRRVDPNVLLLCFAALMLVAAVAMLRRSLVPTPDDEDGAPDGGSAAVAVRAPTSVRTQLTAAVTLKVVAAGLTVGLLAGFLGVGGGFIVVPALVLALNLPMPVAVGTSLLVIAINSAAALVARAGNDSFHWAVIVPFTIAAIGGSLAGKEVAGRVSSTTLTRAFAGLLVLVGAYVAVRSAAGLG